MPPKRKAASASRRSTATPAVPQRSTGEQPVEVAEGRLQTSPLLTTAQGVRLPDTDHSLKAGPRGPSLMDDFHLREKITHFDHERIPVLCRLLGSLRCARLRSAGSCSVSECW